jgi:hypothetical protein
MPRILKRLQFWLSLFDDLYNNHQQHTRVHRQKVRGAFVGVHTGRSKAHQEAIGSFVELHGTADHLRVNVVIASPLYSTHCQASPKSFIVYWIKFTPKKNTKFIPWIKRIKSEMKFKVCFCSKTVVGFLKIPGLKNRDPVILLIAGLQLKNPAIGIEVQGKSIEIIEKTSRKKVDKHKFSKK